MTLSLEQETATQAIMFADVSGSSALYKRFGNVLAKQLIDQAVGLMCELTERHHGQVVKTIGDEVMARFDQAEDACKAAAAIHQQCPLLAVGDEQAMSMRIGMGYGPVLLEADDVFGASVNDAAHVARIARPKQILLTAQVVEVLPPALRNCCQQFDRVQIKGEARSSLIYRFEWESPNEAHATVVMSSQHLSQKTAALQLALNHAGEQLLIGPEDLPFIIGRDPARAHLLVESSLASRDHCHIVLRRGKFLLVDHSTNGTYVKMPDQPEIYLRREELPLTGEGKITIGRRAGQEPDVLIHYRA